MASFSSSLILSCLLMAIVSCLGFVQYHAPMMRGIIKCSCIRDRAPIPFWSRLSVLKYGHVRYVDRHSNTVPSLVRTRQLNNARLCLVQNSEDESVDEEIIRVDVRVEDIDFLSIEEVKEDAVALITRGLFSDAQPSDTELSVVLCSDEFIKELNRNWRGKDSATDVLSFPQDDDDEIVLGDLILSIPTAKRQAEERGLHLRDELRILMLHGFLHLLGYDHETSEEDMVEMAALEEKLMKVRVALISYPQLFRGKLIHTFVMCASLPHPNVQHVQSAMDRWWMLDGSDFDVCGQRLGWKGQGLISNAHR